VICSPASGIVPGQDLSIGLQALLVWLGNYGHISYEKQQEFLRELGGIEIGALLNQGMNAPGMGISSNFK